ncbi:MAG: enoyl-CoA hydratase/isomerase family protein, partial [Chloroflexi bacterium]|nr:enoyl-CoA hydratase/isomerase family protein [Chloroflexota bacterium]
MSRTTVTSRMDGPLAWITFATVDGLNVFSSSVLRELEVAVLRVADDPEVRATVITAEGRVFMAGADIKEMASFDSEQARGYGFLGQGVFNAIAALPSITVAGINGAALGGGLEMALACAFRIAVKSAKLGLP